MVMAGGAGDRVRGGPRGLLNQWGLQMDWMWRERGGIKVDSRCGLSNWTMGASLVEPGFGAGEHVWVGNQSPV